MIEVGKKRKTETYGQISEGMFGISDDDQAHILCILRDKLYSDKVLAVIREYSTNAVDAHIEAGKPELPIQVKLPKLTDPKFVVRDFGPGLSEDKVYNLYTKYGASTKRDTNKAIGQLGLGCKSGFAYSDNFTITSFHDGTKSIYHAFIDETNVGKVVKMHEEPSDEPTGIEISIPVKMKDFDTFRERAMMCYAHFEVIPIVNLDIPIKAYTAAGKNWGIRDLNTEEVRKANYVIKQALEGAVAIMGNIAYPIRAKELPGLKPEETELLNLPLEINFEIGALSISASRESLEYTERTQRNIKFGIKKVVSEFKDKMEERFKNCKTVWEARTLYQKILHEVNRQRNSNFLRSVLRTFSKWNGYDISLQAFEYETGAPNVHGCKIESNSDTPYRSAYGRSVYYNRNPIIVINDTKSAWVKKCLALRQYIEDKTGAKRTIVALRQKPIPQDIKKDGNPVGFKPPKPKPKPPKDFEEGLEWYFKKHGLEGAEVYKLSELKQEVLDLIENNRLRIANPTNKKKLKGSAFKLDNPYLPASGYKPSDDWSKVEVDFEDGKGIYITIHAFRPKDIEGTYDRYGHRKSSSNEFADMMRALKKAGVDPDKLEIYGFRSKIVEKLGKGWVNFNDFFDKKIKEWINNEKILEKIVDMNEYDKMYKLSPSFSKEIVKHKNLFDDPDEFLLEVCEKFNEFHKNFSDINGNMREKLNFAKTWIDRKKIDLEAEPSYPIAKKVGSLKDKYPLLNMAGAFSSYHRPSRDMSIYIDYCNKCKR